MELTIYVNGKMQKYAYEEGQTILSVLQNAKLVFSAPCGGKGTCGKCRVRIKRGNKTKEVLACQTAAAEDWTVQISSEEAIVVERNQTNLSVLAADAGQQGFGIACDIGTTTVVCQLVDLATGAILAQSGNANGQRIYGSDVIARIQAASDGRLEELQKLIVDQITAMAERLCKEANADGSDMQYMTIAGNPTMCHLLTGLSPETIGKAPFAPESLFGDVWSAEKLGFPFQCDIYILPSVSGYVGGDITADMLAVGMDREIRPVLLIDVGTNGEMVIGNGGSYICCSTAAGPAFEGAQITCGMTAAPGAIGAVEYRDGRLECKVIGDLLAKGICGSGLIDAVAVMLELGALDATGRILDPEEEEEDIPPEVLPYLFYTEDDELAFRLAGDIYVTQADIRRLQLGKAAIAAGQKILLQKSGIAMDKVGKLILSGGFGSYIRPESAAKIGMIPEELLPVTRAGGNTAAEGARMALIAREARDRLMTLQKQMNYVELSGDSAFNDAYVDAMMFPGEDDF